MAEVEALVLRSLQNKETAAAIANFTTVAKSTQSAAACKRADDDSTVLLYTSPEHSSVLQKLKLASPLCRRTSLPAGLSAPPVGLSLLVRLPALPAAAAAAALSIVWQQYT
jgi:hypothetical protein